MGVYSTVQADSSGKKVERCLVMGVPWEVSEGVKGQCVGECLVQLGTKYRSSPGLDFCHLLQFSSQLCKHSSHASFVTSVTHYPPMSTIQVLRH